MTVMQEFTKGLWKELPPFRLVLGLCPTLAVTNSADNGLGMGLAVIFVLVLSNMLISMVRSIIPKKVRIACFIVIAASLVVAVELLMQAYAYPLYQRLGIFVPLIVVNCIILGRAEAFAAKNGVAASVADGLGMGLGFTLSLTFLGSLREIWGNGTWFGHAIMWDGFEPFRIMVKAPGAFICLGLILAGMNLINFWQARRKGREPRPLTEGCGACQACNMAKARAASGRLPEHRGFLKGAAHGNFCDLYFRHLRQQHRVGAVSGQLSLSGLLQGKERGSGHGRGRDFRHHRVHVLHLAHAALCAGPL